MANATEKSAMASLSCSSAATFGYTDVMFVTLARAWKKSPTRRWKIQQNLGRAPGLRHTGWHWSLPGCQGLRAEPCCCSTLTPDMSSVVFSSSYLSFKRSDHQKGQLLVSRAHPSDEVQLRFHQDHIRLNKQTEKINEYHNEMKWNQSFAILMKCSHCPAAPGWSPPLPWSR